VMGGVFHYSKSLWSVMVAHSLNDFLAVVIFRL
jgi:membrane protease YdiL (CAAX protease family)